VERLADYVITGEDADGNVTYEGGWQNTAAWPEVLKAVGAIASLRSDETVRSIAHKPR
jgi:hypothetical protein